MIHLFQTVCGEREEGVVEGDGEGDSLISNYIEKSSQEVFSFWSVLNTVLWMLWPLLRTDGFESH